MTVRLVLMVLDVVMDFEISDLFFFDGDNDGFFVGDVDSFLTTSIIWNVKIGVGR